MKTTPMQDIIKAIEERNVARYDFKIEDDIACQRIAHMLRYERIERGLSVREMAKKLKVSAAYLSDIELGRRNVSDGFLIKLRTLK